jgi:hypothetical protein
MAKRKKFIKAEREMQPYRCKAQVVAYDRITMAKVREDAQG